MKRVFEIEVEREFREDTVQVVVHVGHVVAVGERLLVRPFGLLLPARRAEDVRQVAVRCRKEYVERIASEMVGVRLGTIERDKNSEKCSSGFGDRHFNFGLRNPVFFDCVPFSILFERQTT